MRLVIVGAGPGGLTVAETVRRHDSAARITVLAAEPAPPYAPPALAEHFLTGREDGLYWRGRDVAERLGLDFRPGRRVISVGLADELVLADGARVPWDRLVLATGSRLYAPLEGAELPGVANFKSLTAGRELVARARRGEARRAVIVGAGFIGVEVAVVLARLGLEVTVVEALDRVMPRMLDKETAGLVHDGLREAGVRLRLGTRAEAFEGDGRVEAVRLESGERLGGEIFVAATGVRPNLDLAEGAGLEARFGLLVDDRLRTSREGVWAVGDVAETVDRLTGERAVHAIFPNAVAQGRVAGLDLLGFDVRYEGAESMNSLKHVGLPVMAAGAVEGERVLRLRRGRTLRTLVLEGGRLVGFRLTGDVRGAGAYRALMLRGDDVAAFGEALVEPGFAGRRLAGLALAGA